jgi:NAD(P)-dependent dehydrogenase (short-subunit alcohol dehydrogenase family)
MQDFQGKVAVITGGASGIGLAIAQQCAHEGMKLVLADIEEQTLQKTAATFKAEGTQVLTVRTDVSKAEEVERLAEQAFATFGAVHLLFNNAGVGAGTTVWESTLHDWQWVLGVNLWGVIHGIHSFVPRMLEAGEEGHIVNTASSAGLVAHSGLGPYRASKSAVVSISETLALELAPRTTQIKASVLCPEWVQTRILEAQRNRPADFKEAAMAQPLDAQTQADFAAMVQAVQHGLPASEVASITFDAIRNGTFYIITHPTTKAGVQVRAQDIVDGHVPHDVLHPQH